MSIPLSQQALAAAKAAAIAIHKDDPVEKGHPRLTGQGRKVVILAALKASSAKDQQALVKCNNEEIHRWIGAVLDHAKCLLAGAAGYLLRVEKEIGWDNHAPSVVGPAFVRKAVEKMNEAPAPKAEKTEKAPAKGKKAPAAKAETPAPAPKATKKGPPKRSAKKETVPA
jgi:hypothetical protein